MEKLTGSRDLAWSPRNAISNMELLGAAEMSLDSAKCSASELFSANLRNEQNNQVNPRYPLVNYSAKYVQSKSTNIFD